MEPLGGLEHIMRKIHDWMVMKAAKLKKPVNTFLVTLLPPSDEDILLKDLPTDEPTLVRLTWESVRRTGVSGAPWVLLSGLLLGCTTAVPSFEKSTATWLGNVGRDGWRGALPVLGVAEFSACFNKVVSKSPECSPKITSMGAVQSVESELRC